MIFVIVVLLIMICAMQLSLALMYHYIPNLSGREIVALLSSVQAAIVMIAMVLLVFNKRSRRIRRTPDATLKQGAASASDGLADDFGRQQNEIPKEIALISKFNKKAMLSILIAIFLIVVFIFFSWVFPERPRLAFVMKIIFCWQLFR